MQILYNLISHVLEFNRLDEIGVPHQVFLTMQFTSLHFLMILQHRSFPSGCCSPTVSSRHRAAFLEDQSLLVGMNAFLVFTSSMVSLAFDIERSCLASQRLDDDLHCHHTIGPVCCVRVPCSTSYSASCVQNAPSIFWHASWSSPSSRCCSC